MVYGGSMRMNTVKKTVMTIDWKNPNFCMKYTERNRPGVYKMLDAFGVPIRIGKAIKMNLAKRLKDYKNYGRKYCREIERDAKTIVFFEIPSLLNDRKQLEEQLSFMEETMIAEHEPRYNIRLKIEGKRQVPLTDPLPYDFNWYKK